MSNTHPYQPHTSFDGGELDCGSGLLLLLRRHIDPLQPGQLLELVSKERSVAEDLPSWCRLTGNELVSVIQSSESGSYLISKGPFLKPTSGSAAPTASVIVQKPEAEVPQPSQPKFQPQPIPELAVFGIGSWPRPSWMLRSLHDYLEGKLPEAEFQETANDAVKLCVQAQLDAGVGLLSDGEQRRDNYSSFVAARLENTQLVPLTDLLPLVEDPEKFSRELEALDIPASQVRHPGVFGKISRRLPIAGHELSYVQSLTTAPVKVALPGPYLLTRTMWIDCISESIYSRREEIAADLVAALRAEITDLLDRGASLVQLDEPVLTEVVFTPPKVRRSFMCGALGEKLESGQELAFAQELINAVVKGFPAERLALHVCRGNWTTDESVALHGPYDSLFPMLNGCEVGTLLLEYCTERAGSLEALRKVRSDMRVGVGCVNQKHAEIESIGAVKAKAGHAIDILGRDRVLLVPDCGFATFADNPLSSAAIAQKKLEVLAQAARELRE